MAGQVDRPDDLASLAQSQQAQRAYRRPLPPKSSGVGVIVSLVAALVIVGIGAVALLVVYQKHAEQEAERERAALVSSTDSPKGGAPQSITALPTDLTATAGGPLVVKVAGLETGRLYFRANDKMEFKPVRRGSTVQAGGTEFFKLRDDVFVCNYDLISFELEIKNTASHPVDYVTWNVAHDPEMTDSRARIYLPCKWKQIVPLNAQVDNRVSVAPGETIYDTITFQLATPPAPKSYTLTLAGENVGASGPIKFTVPRSLFLEREQPPIATQPVKPTTNPEDEVPAIQPGQ